MNREKIETVLEQINAARVLISKENMPELSSVDLDFDGFSYSLSGLDAYNKVSTAYQALDCLGYELMDLLDLAEQNGE